MGKKVKKGGKTKKEI